MTKVETSLTLEPKKDDGSDLISMAKAITYIGKRRRPLQLKEALFF